MIFTCLLLSPYMCVIYYLPFNYVADIKYIKVFL